MARTTELRRGLLLSCLAGLWACPADETSTHRPDPTKDTDRPDTGEPTDDYGTDSGTDGTEPYTGPYPLTPADRTWVAAEPQDEAGRALDVGDADDDGLDEVLIGTPSGFVYGPEIGLAHSGAYLVEPDAPSGVIDEVSVAQMHGDPERNGDYIGYCTAILGDVSGDGLTDIQVCGGLSEEPPSGNPVFVGPHQGFRGIDEVWAFTTAERDAENLPGATAVGCGDMSGDGQADVCMEASASVANPPDVRGVYVLFGPLSPGPNPSEDYDALLLADITEWAGQTMTGGSDLTGDGRVDLLVGANERDGGRGGAYLVSDIEPGVHDLADWPLWTGVEPLEQAGLGLAVGGDLDGDGLGDAFIGAHIWDGRRGRGFVVTDKDGGSLPDSHLTIEGDSGYDWLGADAAIADFDGDGSDDLAVGIPRDIYFGFDRPGRVALFRGPLPQGVRSGVDADWMLRASDLPDAFGFELDAGNLDGDGRADLVVGAPFDPTAGYDAGAVYLYLGKSLGL